MSSFTKNLILINAIIHFVQKFCLNQVARTLENSRMLMWYYQYWPSCYFVVGEPVGNFGISINKLKIFPTPKYWFDASRRVSIPLKMLIETRYKLPEKCRSKFLDQTQMPSNRPQITVFNFHSLIIFVTIKFMELI